MAEFDFSVVWRYREALLGGLGTALRLNLAVVLLGTAAGLVVALMRGSRWRLLRTVGRIYVDTFRTVPLLVLLVWLFFAFPLIPVVGIGIRPFWAAVIGLSLNLSAFLAEIFRAGLEGVPGVHVDSAQAAGLSKVQSLIWVRLPIAMRLVLPPAVGQYVNQIKLSVLASIIAVPELLHAVNTITTETFRPLELYTVLALLFLAILIPLTWAQGRMEARFGRMASKSQVNGSQESGNALGGLFPECDRGRAPIRQVEVPVTVQVQNLQKSYGARTVLSGVDLVARPGTATALVGSNGCGKTTLLRLIADLEQPDRGGVTLESKVLDGKQAFGAAAVFGYVSQTPEPWPHLSVEGNLLLPLMRSKGLGQVEARREADAWLKFMLLDSRSSEGSAKLSGGQRQRLVIARALCLQASVVLLDEPTAAMDFRWAVAIERLVDALKQAGATVLLVTHSLSAIRRSSDFLLFLDSGQVREYGPTHELLAEPKTAELSAFLRAA